jgi:cell cycle checkpoint control protein RAD9A
VVTHAGLQKKYQIPCVDEEHLAANVERDDYPACITADAHQLLRVLASFQSTLDEITLVARPEDQKNSNLQAIQMVSYVSPSKGKLLPWRSELTIATTSLRHKLALIDVYCYR